MTEEQKYTQNQQWASDKSNFGYRMLQKMGWSEGKGLGLNEDGVKQHIRVKKKLTNQGVGTDPSSVSQWTVPAQVTGGFNDVLSRLASTNHQPLLSMIEKEEKCVGVVGHLKSPSQSYFSRRAAQKNVRKYSEAQLKEIFGTNMISACTEVAKSSPREEISSPEPINESQAREKAEETEASETVEKEVARKLQRDRKKRRVKSAKGSERAAQKKIKKKSKRKTD